MFTLNCNILTQNDIQKLCFNKNAGQFGHLGKFDGKNTGDFYMQTSQMHDRTSEVVLVKQHITMMTSRNDYTYRATDEL